MKKIAYYFSGFALGALLLTGCAKERDKLDKILTDGEWTIESINATELSIKKTDYLLNINGTTDELKTERETTTATSTLSTRVEFIETIETPGNTVFNEKTYVDNLVTTFTFGKDGKFTSTKKESRKSYSSRNQNGSINSQNYSETTRTTTDTGYWTWGNTTQTKSLININGQSYEIKVEKNKITLIYESTNSDSYQGEDGDGSFNYTQNDTLSSVKVFSK